MTGLEYEKVVAQYLRQHGYKRVSVTQGSGDFGIDVIAYKHGHKYAVQCKYYTSAVSLSAVQEAVAGMAYYGCDRAMVVTNNTFTQAAKELANCNNVILLENVKSESNGCSLKLLKGLAIAGYVFIASAIIVATFEMIIKQPILQGLYNLFSTVIFITAPVWLYVLTKTIKKKLGKNNTQAPSQTITSKIEKNNLPVKEPEYPQGFNAYLQGKVFSEQIKPVQTVQVHFSREKQIEALKDVRSNYTLEYSDLFKVMLIGWENKCITTSLIQRKMKYGYSRAARILDILAQLNWVSDYDGSKPRNILVNKEYVVDLINTVEIESEK